MINPQPATLSQVLERHSFHTLLIDASGVLYNDAGPVSEIQETLAKLQQNYSVFIVTNNSYFYIPFILQKLAQYQIYMHPKQIISSGYGLSMDPTCLRLLSQKTVYVFGNDTSMPYVTLAPIKKVTQNLKEADAIILTSSLHKNHETAFTTLVDFLLEHPHIPIICCNQIGRAHV